MFRTLSQAFKNFYAFKLRSFLAVLGIVAGTASVVALLTCGKIATNKALAQLQSLGTDLLSVRLFRSQIDPVSHANQYLSENQLFTLSNKIKGIHLVAPFINVYAADPFVRGHQLQANVIGVTQATQAIFQLKLLKGRFIHTLDTREHFCVIGHTVYESIKKLNQKPVLNNRIQLGNQLYTIIGILQKQHSHAFFPGEINRTVFVPLQSTALLIPHPEIDAVVLKIDPHHDIESLKADFQRSIQAATANLKVLITSPKQIIEKLRNQSRIFNILLGVIGGIALFVGGIGVMNIMLVSVTERKQEIGLRKAIGARPIDIQALFLFESIFLTFFGGILGAALGVGSAYLIIYFAGWAFRIYFFPIIIGLTVSILTGLFFGYYPAYRASRLDPVEALRA